MIDHRSVNKLKTFSMGRIRIFPLMSFIHWKTIRFETYSEAT